MIFEKLYCKGLQIQFVSMFYSDATRHHLDPQKCCKEHQEKEI